MPDIDDEIDNSSSDEVPGAILLDNENSNDNDDEDDDEEEEEDEVVAAFISASSEKNRNYPPNLSVGSNSICGLSFHPNTNIIALGLSNGDIAM